MKTTVYSCPKCKGTLTIVGRCARCAEGHSYDLSREGYLNLLVGKSGGTHGDNREMLLARQTFLSYGYYRPMADTVSRFLMKYAQTTSSTASSGNGEGACVSSDMSTSSGVVRLLDIGCGEGYYTEIFARALDGIHSPFELYGFDISRDAVKLACRKAVKGIEMNFAVASAYHLPYRDGSFSLVSNLFSPLASDEIARVLCDGGYFVMVIPEREHLFGLKRAIYDTPYKNEVAPFDLTHFALVEDVRLTYPITLEGEEISALFAMTPYAYRTSAIGRERIAKLETLSTDIDFHILVYKKTLKCK